MTRHPAPALPARHDDVAAHDVAAHDVAPHGLRRLLSAGAHADALAILVDLDPAGEVPTQAGGGAVPGSDGPLWGVRAAAPSPHAPDGYRLFTVDPSLAPLGRVDTAQHAARCTRAEVTLAETGRATDPGPLVTDAACARLVADLQVHDRQSHGDRDPAGLGRLVVAGADA